MRRVMLLFGAVLCLAVAATAQDNVATIAPSEPAAAAASPQGPVASAADTDWQLAVGYQHNRLRFSRVSYNTNGYNMSLVRFLGSRFGLEGDVGAGFGNTGTATFPNNLSVRTVSVDGGVHVSLERDSRFEPWVHGLVGLEHIRFTQSVGPNSFNTVGWTLGGGADLHFNPMTAIRVEGDYLGTHFSSATQTNFQLIVGLVLNF